MKISMRFSGQVPIETSGTERVRVSLDSGFSFEIVENDGGGVYIRLDHPIGRVLAVVPHASNAIHLLPVRK